MSKYGLLNEAGTNIDEERSDNSDKFLAMPDGIPKINPTHDDFIEAGWLLCIVPVYGVHEKEGPQTIDLDDRTYTNEKIPWSQEEIDFETSEGAKSPQLESINLDFLTGPFAYIPKEKATDLIDSKFPTGTDFSQMSQAEICTTLNDLYDQINWMGCKLSENLIQLNTYRRLTLEEHKNIIDAVVPPSVNDDLSQGFTVGSLWRDILAGKDYVLLDSKIDHADWREVIGE